MSPSDTCIKGESSKKGNHADTVGVRPSACQDRFAKEVKKNTGWKCQSLSAAKHRRLGYFVFYLAQTCSPQSELFVKGCKCNVAPESSQTVTSFFVIVNLCLRSTHA